MSVIDEVVLSLNAVPDLTSPQKDALRRLGIQRISDLLHFRAVHDAQLIAALANGRIIHDFEIAPLLDNGQSGTAPEALLALPVDALANIDEEAARELGQNFGVRTIEQLSTFKPFVSAQQLVAERANAFSEPASAPAELLPTIIGAVQNTINYSTFVKEKTIRLPGVELLLDEDRENHIDPRLAALFPVRGLGSILGVRRRSISSEDGSSLSTRLRRIARLEPELHLGYAARFRQNWVNMGTFLGEVQHSLALAPGESRNIATIDWKRTQVTRREEDTRVEELLTNELVHTRALDEVARSAAFEIQFGGTGTAAGTAAASSANVLGAAAVGGIAGALPAAAVGAAVGGIVGSVEPGIGTAIGAAAGAAGGALIGFGLGAALAGGAALVGTANAQLGVVRSDSSGARAILADLAQDIIETTSQKASSIRSLWSTVFVSDTQAENEQLQTRNITNYDHSHALTIQYFEVLQRYRTEVELASAEPLLFLPFRPLKFTLDLIADYWSVLRDGIADQQVRQRFDEALGNFDSSTGQFREGDERVREIRVAVQRSGFGGLGAVGPVPEVMLIGPAVSRTGDFVVFSSALMRNHHRSPVFGSNASRRAARLLSPCGRHSTRQAGQSAFPLDLSPWWLTATAPSLLT
jgi:hypothetical protein